MGSALGSRGTDDDILEERRDNPSLSRPHFLTQCLLGRLHTPAATGLAPQARVTVSTVLLILTAAVGAALRRCAASLCTPNAPFVSVGKRQVGDVAQRSRVCAWRLTACVLTATGSVLAVQRWTRRSKMASDSSSLSAVLATQGCPEDWPGEAWVLSRRDPSTGMAPSSLAGQGQLLLLLYRWRN